MFYFLMIRRTPSSTLFPSRRSSDLRATPGDALRDAERLGSSLQPFGERTAADVHEAPVGPRGEDRKSTRLNSSHVEISYAVFCLKKNRGITTALIGYPPARLASAAP